MPHFRLVFSQSIPLDAATVTQPNSAAAFGGYNAVLQGLLDNAAAFGIGDALKCSDATRNVYTKAGYTNKMILVDETLTDLGGYFDAAGS